MPAGTLQTSPPDVECIAPSETWKLSPPCSHHGLVHASSGTYPPSPAPAQLSDTARPALMQLLPELIRVEAKDADVLCHVTLRAIRGGDVIPPSRSALSLPGDLPP